MAGDELTRRSTLFGVAAPNGWFIDSGSTTTFSSSIPEPVTITFPGCGIAVNTKTGEVTIPDGLSMSAASRAFWDGLHDAFPGMAWCKK